MRRLFACLLLLLLPSAALAEGPGLVTVVGAIEQTNRGPFEAFRDALFANITEPFERAYQFDAAALAALPQQSLTRGSTAWSGEHAFAGPRLADVLAAVGATGGKVTVVALDGYYAEFTLEEVRASGMLLATAMDGAPLPLGGRGPAYVVFAPGSVASLAADGQGDKGLVWAAVLIVVE